jgi:hypothetical protein
VNHVEDGIINHAFLQESLEFLQGNSVSMIPILRMAARGLGEAYRFDVAELPVGLNDGLAVGVHHHDRLRVLKLNESLVAAFAETM